MLPVINAPTFSAARFQLLILMLFSLSSPVPWQCVHSMVPAPLHLKHVAVPLCSLDAALASSHSTSDPSFFSDTSDSFLARTPSQVRFLPCFDSSPFLHVLLVLPIPPTCAWIACMLRERPKHDVRCLPSRTTSKRLRRIHPQMDPPLRPPHPDVYWNVTSLERGTRSKLSRD